MRILTLEHTPIHDVRHQSAKSGGGTEILPLPIVRGTADGLPDDVDALVFASDLQGVAPSSAHGGRTALLGVALCEALHDLAERGEIPPLQHSGVVLAGDLFSAPGADKRGANGDVTEVWQAFAAAAAFVVGVQGNHDLYNSDMGRLLEAGRTFLLDGSVVDVGGLSVGGVGLIAGAKIKPGRRSEAEQVRRIAAVSARARLVVVHEGPPGSDRHQPGQQFVDDALDDDFAGLLVCGHTHWRAPLAQRARHQVLNVDTRCVVLIRR